MQKIRIFLFFFVLRAFSSLALDLKVSDQYPTLLALGGTIEKVSFGNGNKEYVANQEGRFLEVKAKRPHTSKTTITIYYLTHEGKKAERIDVFFGTVSYDPGIQPLYDLTKNVSHSKIAHVEAADPISETLSEVIDYIAHQEPIIKRFARTRQKITCTLSNMISTGNEIVLKFIFKNNSPYNYQVGKHYFVVNNREKMQITPKIKPSNMVLAPGALVPMIFVIEYKVAKEGLIAHFEEKNGSRDISLKLPNCLLLNIPFWQPAEKDIPKEKH